MSGPPPADSVAVILPVLNEREALGGVLADIPRVLRAQIIVVDNGSTDGSGEVARAAGAQVVHEPRRGYGSACLAGIAAAGDAGILVFLDADRSDDPSRMEQLIEPIRAGRADLVIGSRALGQREPGALPIHARLGNILAVRLIRLIWGQSFTDLGPFRAIRRESLERIGMRDRGYGWTVEMQVRAARAGLRCMEVPVNYRRRVGRSKISGTIRGTVAAGSKILWTIARHALTPGAVSPSVEQDCTADASLSILIPTLDEQDALKRCLDGLTFAMTGTVEVIVVDGGSRDLTTEIASSHPGVRVIRSPPGRSNQLSAGVAASGGSLIWMLHADCVPPAGAARAIRRALEDPSVAIGAFRFALDGSRAAFRVLEQGVALRSRLFRTPYGDQGLFVRRRDLLAAGGIPDVPILEDLALVRAMRRRGRVVLLDLALITSARRWNEIGVVETTCRHLAILMLYRLGVSPRRLARWRPAREAARQAHRITRHKPPGGP